MSDRIRAAAAVVAMIAACTLIALAMTGVYAVKFRTDCRHDGGTFHVSPTLLTCTY